MATRRPRRRTRARASIRPALTGRRKWTVKSTVTVLTPGSSSVRTAKAAALSRSETVAPPRLAEVRPGGDVAADQLVEDRADVDEDVARADDDAAHDAEVLLDAEAGNLERGRHHLSRNGEARLADGVGRA